MWRDSNTTIHSNSLVSVRYVEETEIRRVVRTLTLLYRRNSWDKRSVSERHVHRTTKRLLHIYLEASTVKTVYANDYSWYDTYLRGVVKVLLLLQACTGHVRCRLPRTSQQVRAHHQLATRTHHYRSSVLLYHRPVGRYQCGLIGGAVSRGVNYAHLQPTPGWAPAGVGLAARADWSSNNSSSRAHDACADCALLFAAARGLVCALSANCLSSSDAELRR